MSPSAAGYLNSLGRGGTGAGGGGGGCGCGGSCTTGGGGSCTPGGGGSCTAGGGVVVPTEAPSKELRSVESTLLDIRVHGAGLE